MADYKVPFLDLRVPEQERRELLSVIDKVLAHGRLVIGPEVSEFEKQVAEYCGRKYAVGVNSGTDALILGLKALGIGAGDEVITTSLSWIATANGIKLTGAKPVFADVDNDLNISPESIENLITANTKAIMPVHYTGRICKIDLIRKIAQKHKVLLIEDASQAFGAKYNGKLSGSFGDMACFSMNPMKIYAAIGEAGVILTDDKAIHEKLIILRYNGTINKEFCIQPSHNGRIDTIQAAVLLNRLHNIQQIIEKRRHIAKRYNGLLKEYVSIPEEKEVEFPVYYTYTIRTPKRDQLRDFLSENGIESKIQHPILMPDQKPYSDCLKDYTNAKRLVSEILCLPCHEKMAESDIDYVVNTIQIFFRNN